MKADKKLPNLDEILSYVRYDAETGVFSRVKNGKRADTPMKIGYRRVRTTINKKKHEFLAHRLAWLITYGEWPSDEIDHINGSRSDNRIENLRDVSRAENAKNIKRRQNNNSGIVGIHRHQKGWKVLISKKYVGFSRCFWDAVKMRKAAESRFGYHENHGRT